MARKRDPRRDQAFDIFKKHNGDIPLKDIASQLNVSDGTVRGWKTKDKWDDKLNGTLCKNERNAPLKNTERSKKKKNVPIPNPINKESTEEKRVTIELTPKQQLFVQEYLVDLNATQAAIRAGYSANTAEQIGYQLLQKTSVQKSIQEAMRERIERIEFTQIDVLRQWARIAFADLKHVVTWDDNGIHLKHSDEVDGTILQEISETISPKGGITKSVKINDRMKALESLARHFGMFNDKLKITGNMTNTNIDLSHLSDEQLEKELNKYDDDD